MSESDTKSTAKLSSIYKILNRRDFKVFSIFVTLQTLFTFLDVIAITMIAFLASYTTGGDNRLKSIQEFININKSGNPENSKIIIYITICVIILFALKTLLNVIVTKKIYGYLAFKSAKLAKDIISKVLDKKLPEFKKVKFQEIIYNSSRGVQLICLQILAPLGILISDAISLVLLTSVLIYVSWKLTFVIFSFFALVIYILSIIQNTKVQLAGKKVSELEILANTKVNETLHAYRELYVLNRKTFYPEKVFKLMRSAARPLTTLYFFPTITKFVFEGLLIFCMAIVGISQALTIDKSSSISLISIFLAAGVRIAPIALRAQQNILQIKSNLGVSGSAMSHILAIQKDVLIQESDQHFSFPNSIFVPEVSLINVTYLTSQGKVILKNINFHINSGEKIVIAGTSGSGKTTLVEIILGLIPPTKGELFVSGTSIENCIKYSGELVGYVPQNFQIISGTIRENLSLGFETNNFSEDEYWRCLNLAKLDVFVQALPNKLESRIGERGLSLSGGERQRLAIARALITKPKLLIIDEGTSALDLPTEAEITKEILNLGTEITVIIVTHRINSMQEFDNIVFLSNGQFVSKGSFSELVTKFPQFEQLIRNNS